MIAGKQIAEELSKLIGSGGYDPDSQINSGKLPMTMRDLVEGKFDTDFRDEFYNSEYDEDENNSCNIKAGSAMRIYKNIPIRACQFNRIQRPKAPQAMPRDYRGYYPLLSSYYDWLRERGEADGVDIDHPLERNGWPLFIHFVKEVKKRTGWDYDEFFTMEEDEYQTGEPQIWEYAYLPLWQVDRSDDDVPLIELLGNISAYVGHQCYNDIRLPEVVYDQRSGEDAEKATTALREIIQTKKFNLLPGKWAKAVKFIISEKCHAVYCNDPIETQLEIDSADSIQFFFNVAPDIVKMRENTYELVQQCQNNCKAFWNEIIDCLIKLPIKVKNEEKIKIKV